MGKQVVVTRGLDNCLAVYTQESWRNIVEKLGGLSISKATERGFSRFVLSGATEVAVDSLGRILLPDYLREFAGVEKKVVWTGAGDKAEIWSEQAWEQYVSVAQSNPEELAESLDGLI